MYFSQIPALFKKVYPQAIWSSRNDPKLKWTFDDGPHPGSTPALLKFLKSKKITATFFCLGKQVEKHPELFRKILSEGHQVGNHGYHHLSGWNTSSEDYLNNIIQAQEIIDSNLFRPAYGRMTWKQYQLVRKSLGLDIIMWSNMPGDFDRSISSEKLAQRLQNIPKKNSLTVLHDEPKALDRLLKAWK